MANQVTNYKCPACTGPLHYVGASGKLECDYCGSKYDIKEIEELMKESESQAQTAFSEAETKAERNRAEAETYGMPLEEEQWGEGMKAYACPSCGAELVCDETTVATSCPYCGNPTVVPGQFSGMMKPDYIIPFKLDENAAKNALKKHYEGKRLLPNSFASQNHIDELKGVYVPFWFFDGVASGNANFTATKNTRKHRRGDVEITEKDHYNVFRAGNISFSRVPVDASSKMPDNHMDSIEPYDYSDLKEFSSVYLPGFLADKYDVSVEDSKGRATERAKQSALDALSDSVKGYETKSMTNSSVSVSYSTHHYAMMPVYLLATRWENQSFLFAMNGQTGKLIGDLPIDNGKFWKYFISIFLGVTIVLGTILHFVL